MADGVIDLRLRSALAFISDAQVKVHCHVAHFEAQSLPSICFVYVSTSDLLGRFQRSRAQRTA
ncbi:hypothetical protein L484_007646 [Morus notabilis]|uniref:Uncharacterized protein n=1 Tax=Morus notabilis TaxID=981085 RepID=W9R6G0_9ROSA|nr:hypothetical protein L484_007646 [Morus notabilis]